MAQPIRKCMECPICESLTVKSLFQLKGTDVVECQHCSLIYVPSPAPDFSATYKADYFASQGSAPGYSNYSSEFTSHLVTFSKRLEETEKILTKVGRVLDVGCALGHLGEAARRRGWDVYVTDVSEFAVLRSREQFGLNGFISAPHKLALKAAKFDLVTFYDIIEHLSFPLEILKQVRKALTSHGILHVVTPNIQSLTARIMGKHWYHIKPDEHLIYFTPETLRAVLERAGFEVIKIKPAPTYMRLNDILLRLERYSKPLTRFSRQLAKLFGLADLRLKIYVGEMQAWAKPAGVREVTHTEPVKDILDIVCCSNCRSELQLFEEKEAICTQCELSFEVIQGVINFSKYAKRGKTKLVGNS